jgi:hypothetical protein
MCSYSECHIDSVCEFCISSFVFEIMNSQSSELRKICVLRSSTPSHLFYSEPHITSNL